MKISIQKFADDCSYVNTGHVSKMNKHFKVESKMNKHFKVEMQGNQTDSYLNEDAVRYVHSLG